jgi:23S rRNA pseudouridine955/2504/2580 synthase
MKEFTIGKNDAGQRLDRWLGKTLPLLPAPLAQKYIRLKRVKVNGKGSAKDARLVLDDLLQLYINDEFFETPSQENAFLSVFKPQLDIVYEDENLLLVNKRPGLVVHPDDNEYVNTLITHIQAYLYQKKEWSPYQEHSFAPALCNRIDRNTGGIVIAAKNAEALRVMNQKIKDREMEKYYLCIIHGKMTPPEGTLEGFLLKDEEKKQVSVYHHPVPGGRTAVTHYRTLEYRNELSLIECELVTGRTHQIRAQFADAGHPLLGDGKYGRERDNARYDRKFQALYSYKLVFSFTTDSGVLESLNGKKWEVPDVPFVEEYFPKQLGK